MTTSSGLTLGFGICTSLVWSVVARRQDGPAERHQKVLRFLKKTAAQLSERSLVNINSVAEWQRQRSKIRAQLLSMLGLIPFPKRTSLQDRITGVLYRPKFRIEKIAFQSLPGLPLMGRYTLLILNPRLTEQPVTAFEYAEIERTSSWIGRTVASMQVWDILRAVEWITHDWGLTPASISPYEKGTMGVLSPYAGLFDRRVQRVILRDPPVSHQNGAALLNVLRVTDIPKSPAPLHRDGWLFYVSVRPARTTRAASTSSPAVWTL